MPRLWESQGGLCIATLPAFCRSDSPGLSLADAGDGLGPLSLGCSWRYPALYRSRQVGPSRHQPVSSGALQSPRSDRPERHASLVAALRSSERN
jgi:hypothetical protein